MEEQNDSHRPNGFPRVFDGDLEMRRRDIVGLLNINIESERTKKKQELKIKGN